jgi:hypothetical protein
MKPRAVNEGIEVADDMAFQRRSWRVQRLGRWLVFAFVGVALTGAFGGGGLAKVQAISPDGRVAVEHRRVLRNEADAHVAVRFTVPDNAGNPVLWMSESLLAAFELEGMTPRAEREWSEGGRVVWEFDRRTRGALEVRLQLRARETGRHAGEIGLVGAEAARVSLWVLP